MQKLKLIKDLSRMEETFRKEIEGVFSKGDGIAVKLHMGETRNPYYLKPEMVKRIINVLKENGLNPFLFDSIVRYAGGRDSVEKYYKTAEMHGFKEDKIGCPIVISDEYAEVKTKDMVVQVCKTLAESDGMVVLSHVKGHACCGFGGAIKNLGMGGVTKKSKADIHNLSMPEFVGECIGCGTCARVCPAKAIEIINGKAEIDLKFCWGCSSCELNCPEHVLKPKTAIFDDLLAQGAKAVLSKCRKAFFVNFLINISRKCDCANEAGPLVVEDIGVLFGKDAAAIDTASVDLVNKQKPGIFKKLHNHDPYLQIDYARKMGLGEENYDIS